jgi:uncharacterized protein involved in response to NO
MAIRWLALPRYGLAGRVAVAGSTVWGGGLAAVVDIAFLATLAGVALREIVAGKNWRNLRVLIVLGVLIAGNIVFHLEAIEHGSADYGIRLSIAAVIGLIMLVGGRIVPSFTHNWLVRNNPGRLPRTFSRFDALALSVSALALAMWIVMPQQVKSGGTLMIAGLLQAARLARWAGDRTFADRLVLVLHLGYACLSASSCSAQRSYGLPSGQRVLGSMPGQPEQLA